MSFNYMSLLRKTANVVLFTIVAFYLLIAPFTKVEESFGLQAIHDILNYGIGKDAILERYDHIKFPGAVPRTFIGSLIVAALVKAIDMVVSMLGISLTQDGVQFGLQTCARATIGIMNIYGFLKLRDSLDMIALSDRRSKVRGLTGFWFIVLLSSQFHLLYYCSRTLPNFVALPFVNYSLSKILVGDISGLAWLGFTGIVFRLEVGLLGGCIAIASSLFGQSNLVNNVLVLIGGSFLGALISFPIDSYFWNSYLIPEITSFSFNILEGNSTNWGVEPWNTYFTKYLQQLFRPPTILLLVFPGLIKDPAEDHAKRSPNSITHPARHSIRILVIAAVMFIVGMSFQPHKEWRFIVYAVPIFTCSAANGLASINSKWSFSLTNKLLLLIMFLLTIFGTILSLFMGYVSSFNYPGGDSILFVNEYVKSNSFNFQPLVHMDVASCMTGISRFLEIHDNTVKYDKTENIQELSNIWEDLSIVITESVIDRSLDSSEISYTSNDWEELSRFQKYEGITLFPLIRHIQHYRKDETYVSKLLSQIFSELKGFEFTMVRENLRSFIRTSDYLHVYKRKGE